MAEHREMNVSDAPTLSRDEIFAKIVEILSDSFELDPKKITRESTLYDELDLDSIDAIDIFTQLRETTGRRPDPADARQVRTVDELIDFVLAEIEKVKAGVPDGPSQGAAGADAEKAPGEREGEPK
jgi:acyl carrier protein